MIDDSLNSNSTYQFCHVNNHVTLKSVNYLHVDDIDDGVLRSSYCKRVLQQIYIVCKDDNDMLFYYDTSIVTVNRI